MKQYSAGLWHATKIGFYTTTSDDKLNFQTENKLQSTSWSQTPFIKLVMVTIWWSAVGLIHYSFLSPGKTITPEKYTQQINELHWKLQCCSKCWSTERAQLFSGTTPDYISHNQPFKSWTNWATNFCLICEIHLTTHQMTTSASSILTTFFCRENASTTSRRQKMLSRVYQIPKHGVLCYRNKQSYFHWQKCVDCNVSYFD